MKRPTSRHEIHFMQTEWDRGPEGGRARVGGNGAAVLDSFLFSVVVMFC